MSKDRHFRRRMTLNKFNNRPPFNLKKFDGSTSTADREQAPCAECYNEQYMSSADKSYRSVVKYLEKIDDTYNKSMKNKSKNIIPKIIESFQKVTPKKRSKIIRNRQKSDSLHTLYRNNNSNFGKNIPNHKLMKKLLKNLDTEETESNNQDIDVIPSRDTNRSIQRPIIKKSDEVSLTVRVDKKTSTTGLQWPIVLESRDNFQVDIKPSTMNISNKNIERYRTRIPQKKISAEQIESHKSSKFINRSNLKNYTESKKSVCSSDLEYFPTKELPNIPLKKPDYVSKIPTKQNVHIVTTGLNKLNLNKQFPRYKFNSGQNELKNAYSHIPIEGRYRNSDEKVEKNKKEKSFVQLQVEKYNKINKKNVQTKNHLSSNNTLKNVQASRKNINKNYMNIMTTMRENLPRMRDELAVELTGESREWSDNTMDTEPEVKFPKETRNAMEHIIKQITRIPLAKCTKNQNLQLQPAISINSQYRTECEECRETSSGTSYKKTNQLPCSKNLLCERGNHDGICTRIEKVHPPRYNNHRIRPKHKA